MIDDTLSPGLGGGWLALPLAGNGSRDETGARFGPDPDPDPDRDREPLPRFSGGGTSLCGDRLCDRVVMLADAATAATAAAAAAAAAAEAEAEAVFRWGDPVADISIEPDRDRPPEATPGASFSGECRCRVVTPAAVLGWEDFPPSIDPERDRLPLRCAASLVGEQLRGRSFSDWLFS